MTFQEAKEKAKRMIKENNRQIYFIMDKNNESDVFVGWDGRDEALKNGWKFPNDSH